MKSAKTSGRRRRRSATFTVFLFSFLLSTAGVKSKINSKTSHGVHEGRERERKTPLLRERERGREREREQGSFAARERKRERRDERGRRHFCCGQVFQRTQWNFPRQDFIIIIIILLLFMYLFINFSNFVV
jgi:hypothetical protein